MVNVESQTIARYPGQRKRRSKTRKALLDAGLRVFAERPIDALAAGQARSEAVDWGVTYWVGLCYSLMAHIVGAQPDRDVAEEAISAMIAMSLDGIKARILKRDPAGV